MYDMFTDCAMKCERVKASQTLREPAQAHAVDSKEV